MTSTLHRQVRPLYVLAWAALGGMLAAGGAQAQSTATGGQYMFPEAVFVGKWVSRSSLTEACAAVNAALKPKPGVPPATCTEVVGREAFGVREWRVDWKEQKFWFPIKTN